MSIRTKLVFTLFLAVVALTIAAVLSVNYFIGKEINTIAKNSLQLESQTIAYLLETELNLIKSEVKTLSLSPPIQGIIRAKENDNYDLLDKSSTEQWVVRLQTIMKNMIASSDTYLQLRYLDKSGQELVRVDSNGSSVRVVPPEGLQNKANRYYFQDTIRLPKGALYLSDIDLNREGSPPTITFPHTPVLRIATPIYDETNSLRGIVIANVNAGKLLKTLTTKRLGNIEVIDHEGYYLRNPDSAKQWGGSNNLNTGIKVQTEDPQVTKLLDSTEVATASIQNNIIVGINKIHLWSDDRYIAIVYRVDDPTLKEPLVKLSAIIAGIGITFILVFSTLIILLVRFITKPLAQLEDVAQKIAGGDFSTHIQVTGSTEIARLANLFNTMQRNLARARTSLEDQVKEKTQGLEQALSKLNKQNLLLGESQKAMTNILEDVQAEKQRVDNLAQDLEKFKLAVDNSSDGVVITDKDALVIYANKAISLITGFSNQEILGNKCGKLWGGRMDQAFYQNLWDTVLAKKPFEGEVLNHTKSGDTIMTSLTISPILDKDGEIEFFVELLKDITNDYEHKQELQKFQLAVENATDHIIITDANGIIIFANPAVERITGFTRDEVIGKKAGAKELWGGLMDAEFYKKFWHVIKVEKKSFTGEVKNKRKSGDEYNALATVSPVLNNAGEVVFFIGIERDITKEKNVDRMKTEFISLASHQLRTPLSAMKWFLEILLGGDAGELTQEQNEYISNINQSNERMIDLVNGLLNISRIESGRIIIEPTPTNLQELIHGVVTEVEPRMKEKNQTLTVSVHPDLPEIMLDQKLIRNVYMNLLTNSTKYTPENGDIEVIISRKDDEIISQVTDNGFGIPKDEQPRLFQKFFRATNILKTDTDGTGLGLYLLKTIIDSSNGKLWFESEEGKGTTFWFSLPVSGMKAKKGEVSLDS